MKGQRNFSIKTKMYIFVIITVLAVVAGASAISFRTEAAQIDRFYKQNTADNARNLAAMVDGDYLRELRAFVETEEFQAIREKAEAEENEKLIEECLREEGLWEQYFATRQMITSYLGNMKGIKYLYITAQGDENADSDMYLVDDDSTPLYETGYYEEREEELLGIDLADLPEPTISHGSWGWLCSDFKPVYDAYGQCVCVVGCDIGMDDVMAERRKLLMYLVIGFLLLTSVVLAVAVLFINRTVVDPLNSMTTEMKKFTPSENLSYEDAGVIDIDIKSNDEIGEIYRGIRDMQIRIIDYLRDMQQARHDLKDKDEQIGQLSIESYTDALTGVGNKAAYIKKADELNSQMKEADAEFAIVMVDLNNLKYINDEYGHRAGDAYIKGCCHMMCEAFKHSPVFRVGGDEFVAVLIGHDYENRWAIVDQLKSDYEDSYNKGTDPWLKYSAAVGLAENASGDDSVEFVFKRADERMYENKAQIKKKHGDKPRD